MRDVIFVLCFITEFFLQYVSVFMVQKYVFLESGLERKKEFKYYVIAFLIGVFTHIFSLSAPYLLLIVGINIALGRKKKKFQGIFLSVPIMGMVNGLFVPIVVLPTVVLKLKDTTVIYYAMIIYLIVLALLVLFYFKGKKWREDFYKELEYRRLQTWEKVLLWIIGINTTISAAFLQKAEAFFRIAEGIGDFLRSEMRGYLVITGVTSFVMTIVIIVLIMQGNKRSYFYEKSMDMKEMEMEKQKAEAANEAKSLFLSNMSHEIRTPMNAIVGMTDILLREDHSPQTVEYLNNIKNSGAALITIINDILDFSKIESGKMEIVEDTYEPMSMLNDLSMIFHNRIGEKRVELLYDVDKDMPRKVYGDVQRIRQVIINLMNNAIKFTDSGYVKLTVVAEPLGLENVAFTFYIEDTGQGIKPEDIGKLFASFSQVDMQKNHSKEGSGLGLAISKQLVELMNGSIGVKSEYGKGSTFYFTIPQRIMDVRVATKLQDKAKKSRVAVKIANTYLKENLLLVAEKYNILCTDLGAVSEPGTEFRKLDFLFTDDLRMVSDDEKLWINENGGKVCVLCNPMKEVLVDKGVMALAKPLYSLNFCQVLNREERQIVSIETEDLNFTAPDAQILVVDDNEMNIKVAKGLLAPYKLQVDVAENGQEALLKVQSKEYHMVFMDHMMPVMDGVEATRAIRKLEGEYYKNLPIIALSANATIEAREMFHKESMNDFIAKPIRVRELAKSMLKWLPQELICTQDEVVEEIIKEINYPEIADLNVEEGVKNCGSEELFYSLMTDFYKLIDAKSKKVEAFLKEGKIKDYTIEVHALKSMARMIGAMDLSEQFYQLEKLGNSEEVEEITKRTPKILEWYQGYKDSLKQHVMEESTEKAEVSNEEIKAALMQLKDAVDSFDLDGADEAMQTLKGYDFPDNMKPMIEELEVLVTDVAMEDIMELTDRLAGLLDEGAKEEVMDAGVESDKALVMLIDDDSINRKAVQALLKDEYRFVAVESGKEAFEKLKALKPDLILLDVYMPEMDGHEVITALKEHSEYADIPVIFLTSDIEENTEIKGFSEGAIDFMRKPLRKDVAIQRIGRILELSYLQKNLQEEVEKQTEVAEKRRESVERLSLQMVEALANTIDAKDSYTNGHSTRVAQYSVMLAKKMGYEGEKLEQLQYAAMLHDIGKIGVPREIINKPSKLTDEEYAIIKTHPAIGENILKEITEIPDIAIGARWHHERFDGRGYPDGLAGIKIPELARIIGVADAYDAMTSKRSYRDVLPQEVVLGELEKGKSTQFDPEIASLMMELIREDTEYTMHE